jgi:acylphosphatase
MASSSATKLLSCDYEIFGKVQGVFFRKFTNLEATKLKLVGWVMNTQRGTVEGTIQGKEDAVKKMKEWLSKTGSPQSKIERAEFRNERELTGLEYKDFEHKKGKKE